MPAPISSGGTRSKDFTVRFFDFFDHYRNGAPAKWMTGEVPFLQKSAMNRPVTQTTADGNHR